MDQPNIDFNIFITANSEHHIRSMIFLASCFNQKHESCKLFLIAASSDYPKYSIYENIENIKILLIGRRIIGSSVNESLNKEFKKKLKVSDKTSIIKKTISNLINRPNFGKFFKFFVEFLKETSIGNLYREKIATQKFEKDILECGVYFDLYRPSLVLSFGDRHPDIEVCVLFNAMNRNIKILIPYLSNYETIGGLKVRRDFNGNTLKGFHTIFPFSLYRIYASYKFRKQIISNTFFHPPFLLNALCKLKVLSSFPWCNGNGVSSIVTVDTKRTYNLFKENFVPESKLNIAGGFAFDKLYENFINQANIKVELYKKYNFNFKKKLIILAVPQGYEQGIIDKESHWLEVNYIVEQLSLMNYNFLLSVHPRCDLNHYAFLSEKYNCKIAEEPSYEILPACDIFVAAYTSLFVWAAMCGIRSICCDFNNWNLDIYDYLTSVKRIQDRKILKATIYEIINDKKFDFKKDWDILSRNEVFDGQTIKRYFDLIV